MKTSLTDIANIEDIKILVNKFYDKVNTDTLLSPIFNEVAKIDWNTHLTKMYDFWNMIIFGSRTYQGSPMGMHVHLATLTTMGEAQFERWTSLFFETMDELYAGPNAQQAKDRATAVAATMLYKIKHSQVSS